MNNMGTYFHNVYASIKNLQKMKILFNFIYNSKTDQELNEDACYQHIVVSLFT